MLPGDRTIEPSTSSENGSFRPNDEVVFSAIDPDNPATTSGKPVLLKINMEAGHGGAAGRFDYLKEVAHDYAFAVWAVDKGWQTA